MRTASLQIRTPEGIVFSQLLAGPVTRFLAWLIDGLCILVIMILLAQLTAFLVLISSDLAFALYSIGYFVVSIGYGTFFEWRWRGQTPGKRLFHLRVVDAEGLRLQFHQVVTRNLLRFVDSLPVFYFVGGIVSLLSSACQRPGDIAANTIVIRHPKVPEPDVNQLVAGKFKSLRQQPQVMARLRQRVTPAEASLAVQALLRRDEFDPAARLQLFASLAGHFRSKVEFPPELIEGITDEQFVRNVVDVLYRPGTDATAQQAAA